MHTGLHIKYQFLHILNKLEYSRQIFENTQISNFIKNPPSGGGVVPRGRTDMTKLLVAFRNFGNARKNGYQSVVTEVKICSVLACY
jgi:hypothetical protein